MRIPSPPFPVAEVAGLDLLFTTPTARPPELPAAEARELAAYEQRTCRSIRMLDWGLDVWEAHGKVLNLQWTSDQTEIRLSRFERGHWDDDLLRAADEHVGGESAEAWIRHDAVVDALIASGVAAAVDDRNIDRRHLETISRRHRGSTVQLLEALLLPPAVVARVNRSLFGHPTARFLWWVSPHEDLDGHSVVQAITAGLLGISPVPGRDAGGRKQHCFRGLPLPKSNRGYRHASLGRRSGEL